MEDGEYVSSSVKHSTGLLQAEKHDARVVPRIKEQLHVSDQRNNFSPVFSNFKPDTSGNVSATSPKFYHATSYPYVAMENQCLNRGKVRDEVDLLEAIQIEKLDKFGNVSAITPNFHHATSCTNMAKEIQCLKRDEVIDDMDSLEAIQIEQFNVGQITTPKEKKGACGRPKKSLKGVLSSNENTTLLDFGYSSLETHNPKKIWKRNVDNRGISTKGKEAGPNLGEKGKVAETDSKEVNSFEGEKRKKMDVYSVRTYVFHMLGSYVSILCNWLIL